MVEYRIDGEGLRKSQEYRVHRNVILLMILGAIWIYYIETYKLVDMYELVTTFKMDITLSKTLGTLYVFLIFLPMVFRLGKNVVILILQTKHRRDNDILVISEDGIYIKMIEPKWQGLVNRKIELRLSEVDDIYDIVVFEKKNTTIISVMQGKLQGRKENVRYFIDRENRNVKRDIQRIMPNKLFEEQIEP